VKLNWFSAVARVDSDEAYNMLRKESAINFYGHFALLGEHYDF
jgi:hypothetical protein